MTVQKFLARLVANAFYVASGNIVASQVLDVTAWKAAALSGGYVVLDTLRSLAKAYRDGTLTRDEFNDLFGPGK